MCENIGRPIYHLLLVICEVRKEIRHEFLQVGWIITVDKDGVRKPSFVEIPSSLDSNCVRRRVGERNLVPSIGFKGYCPVDSQRSSQMIGFAMSQKYVVTTPVWLLVFRNRSFGEVIIRQGIAFTMSMVNNLMPRP